MELEDTNLSVLPPEILIIILKNVSSFDLLQFCEAYNNDFLKVKSLVSLIDLSKNYKLKDLQIVINNVNLTYIKKLNINGLYWIHASDLKKLLPKLVNLETLLAIDTILDFKVADLNIYSKLKLKKLAVNVRQDISIQISFPTIECLYLKFFINATMRCRQIFPSLKVLWVDDTTCSYNGGWVYNNVDRLMYTSHTIYFQTVKEAEYITHRSHQPNIVWFDNVNLPVKTENSWPEDWQILQELHCEPPYPYKTLYALKEKNINDIMLDELNFQHKFNCSIRYNNALKSILSSAYTKNLKKLSIDACVFNCDCCEIHHTYTPSLNKRVRLGLRNEPCRSLDNYFLRNLPNLEVLEIYICFHDKVPPSFNSILPIISEMKCLKYLALELPFINNGRFLISVLTSCTKLEVLQIISKQHNDVLNINLCKALINANLKDFKYQNRLIPISRILDVFCINGKSKLERLSIVCDEIDCVDYAIMERFFECNPQLVFLYFRFNKCPSVIYKNINSILSKFRRQHPAAYFVITKPSIIDQQNSSIPDVHFSEMVLWPSIVSSPDAYQEFENF